MSGSRDLLLEIGTEELPPSELEALGAALVEHWLAALDRLGLGHGVARGYAAPRRLAVVVDAVAEQQAEESVEHRGPPADRAFGDDGEPTPAAAGFARRHGVAVADLERRATGKGEYLYFTERRGGGAASELLPAAAAEVALALPARKRMAWGVAGVTFPRPVHWAVLLFGREALDARILGVDAGAHTHGHRFHHPEPIPLTAPSDYASALRAPGHVIADFAERSDLIREQVAAAAATVDGRADLDPELVAEVAALVEWPVALAGRFDPAYLDVPAEALVAVMKDHQRYFPVHAADGRLLPAFVTVANIDSRDPGVVRAGNERVIEPRFADAQFFWDQDRRRDPGAFNAGLAAMVFHPRLGTMAERVERMRAIAGELAAPLGADAASTQRAADLAKFDLLTQMVGEFPELQGIMGGYYARQHGEDEAVARAIAEQYRPAYAGDAIPATAQGAAVALADRLDVLVGLFAIGQPPTGDKDPFALRRSALGALRILIEGGHDLDLQTALAAAAGAHADGLDAHAGLDAVFDFMLDRLRVYYQDQGFAPDVIDAVRARRPSRPLDFDRRLRALAAFRERPEAGPLSEANKRIRNILRKTAAPAAAPDPAALAEPAERALHAQVAELADELDGVFAAGDYTRALARLGELAGPLDAFFDQVMVMTDDADLRANRLALLDQARGLFLRVADLSRLQAA